MSLVKTTRNLFDFKKWINSFTAVYRGTFTVDDASFTITATENDAYTASHSNKGLKFYVKPNTYYALSWRSNNKAHGDQYIFFDYDWRDHIKYDNYNGTVFSFVTPENVTFITVRFGVRLAGDSITYSDIQLEEGTEATPYIPHTIEVDRIVQTTRNLFDKSIDVYDHYLIKNGELVQLTGQRVSNYIPINSDTLTISGIYGNSPSICLYDENKEFIKGYQYGGITQWDDIGFSKTIDCSGAYYTRFSFTNRNINNIQLELGSEATPYIPHTIEVDRIVQTTRNLFDKDAEPYINDVYINWDGSTTPAIGFAVYKIPITKGTYTITHTSMANAPGYVIYDSNDNIISGDAYSGRGVFTFDAPDNSDYILVSVVYDVDGANAYRRDIDFFQLEEGTEATSYIPHIITTF